MAEKNVLLVTDWFGILHVTPAGNKSYYESQNAKNKNLQFGIKEMSEKDAYAFVDKNKGVDPNFVKPGDANKIISEKDQKIKDLEAELEKLKAGSAASTDTKVPAKELIEKINAVTKPEEIDELVTKDEDRVTVIDAAKAKRKELKDAAKNS
jgi:hypothetical protein